MFFFKSPQILKIKNYKVIYIYIYSGIQSRDVRGHQPGITLLNFPQV